MGRSDNSDSMTICGDICCSLLMLLLGIFFCFPLTMLIYFTYQTIASSRQFCSLWIDVPGRLVILLICYYIASICGFLPLPQRYHLHGFIVPFNVWELRSWRRLFRIMCFHAPSRSLIKRLRRNVESVQENLETPLLQENNQECIYTCSPRRRRTTPIDIPYPEKYSPPVFVSNPETTPRNESPGIIKSSNGLVAYIDTSFGDIVLPIMPEKSSKRHYISESTIKKFESLDDRDRVPSEYRRRFTEIKWPGEAAAPPSDYQATIRERPAILTPDEKFTAATDDERLAISRRQGLGSEMPEVHIKKNLELVPDARTSATNPPAASERPLCDKYFELADKETLVARRQPKLRMSVKKGPKLITTDDMFKEPGRNEPLTEVNDQSRVHERNLHPGRTTCSNKREAEPEYLNTEAQLKFSGARKKIHKRQGLTTDPAIARESRLNKYFEMTDDESLVTSPKEESQISVNERPGVHIANDRFKVVTKNELPLKTSDQPIIHKRNLYPGEASFSKQRGASSEARNRNQQSRRETISNEKEIQSRHSRQMNFPEALGRNQQSGRETACSKGERVVRVRSHKTSLIFPLPPLIILSNPKRVSIREIEHRKQHLESVKRDAHEMLRRRKTNESNVDLTTNRCDTTQKQGTVNTSSNHAINLNRSLVDGAASRHPQLPSLRFQVYPITRSQIQDETEVKMNEIEHEKYRTGDQNDPKRGVTDEAGPSNLPKLEEDNKRTGMVTPVTQETSSESFNRLRFDDLFKKLTLEKQNRTHLNIEASAAVESSITTDKNDKGIGKSNIQTKPNEAETVKKSHVNIIIDSPLITSGSDSDSDQK